MNQIESVVDEYERQYRRGDVVLAEQAHKTLAAMIGMKRAALLCAEIRRRIDLETTGVT